MCGVVGPANTSGAVVIWRHLFAACKTGRCCRLSTQYIAPHAHPRTLKPSPTSHLSNRVNSHGASLHRHVLIALFVGMRKSCRSSKSSFTKRVSPSNCFTAASARLLFEKVFRKVSVYASGQGSASWSLQRQLTLLFCLPACTSEGIFATSQRRQMRWLWTQGMDYMAKSCQCQLQPDTLPTRLQWARCHLLP